MDHTLTPRRCIEMDALTGAQRYFFLISAISPRPIAWVSSLAADGTPNLAPFSFFQGVASDPAVLMLALAKTKSDGNAKDTLSNIQTTREFVVGSVDEDQAEPMIASSHELPAEENEFQHAGVETFPSQRVAPACIATSGVNLECRLYKTVEVGNSVAIFGEVLLAHVREDLLDARGTVDTDKLRPLGRLGGSHYMLYGAATRLG